MKRRILKHYFVITDNKIIFNSSDIKEAFLKAKEIFNKENKTIKIQCLKIPVSKLRFIFETISTNKEK